MRSTLPLFVVEPSGERTRRSLAAALIWSSARSSLQDLRPQLREMRERVLGNQDSLVAAFRDAVSWHPETEFLSAQNGVEAAELVRRIAGNTRNVVLNRASSVVCEMKPHLQQLGLRVIQPYPSEQGSFENKIRDYWDLPSLLTNGLVPNFEPRNVKTGGVAARKDCVAVLGVSAACAQDGSVFLLQHSSNISQAVEQAAELVLIAGLDKVVDTRDDAGLQTRCMGIFGLEAMLLNLRQRQDAGAGMADLPAAARAEGQRWHVILLDNGRRKILSSSLRELLLCIGCRRCVVRCPINHSMGRGGTVWSPRDHLFLFLLGQNPLMDVCLHCEACRVECPLSIDLPGLMWKARADAAGHGRSLSERLLGNPEALARTGTLTAPVSSAVVSLKPARALVGSVLGFDSERSLPAFHRQTFAKWLARSKRDAKSKDTRDHAKLAYFPGCFANYYQPDLARSVVNVLTNHGIEVTVPAHKCCGTPMMANRNLTGFLRNAERNVLMLASLVAEGWEVVTSCPSCALMMKHGYPALCRQAEAGLVSQHVFYIDEYLVRLGREGWPTKDTAEVTRTVLCHIPCHLRAQDEGRSTLELLRSVPGLTVTATSATCCGMGGYHGFRRTYSGLSMDIGRKLFDDIKNARADMVVTSCAACGMQIRHGTGVTAMHPVQILERACGLDRHRGRGGKLA